MPLDVRTALVLLVRAAGPALALALSLLVLPSPAAAERTRTLAAPMLHGLPVDWCATFASGCGQPGADQFCRWMGWDGATHWEVTYTDSTYVLGDGRTCTSAGQCGSLTNVTCVSTEQELGYQYANPTVEGRLVDWCRTFATDCGKPAADQFCAMMGHGPAKTWHLADANETIVLGDRQVCSGANACRHFTYIFCAAEP